MMSPGGNEASSGSDTVPPFGFAKGDLDADGEVCDAPRARCDQIEVGRDRFVRAEVEVRFTARTVEIFQKGERIAAHQRMSGNHKHTTVPEHMASSHRRYAGWTIEHIRKDAASRRCASWSSMNARIPNRAFAPVSASSGSPESYGHERLDAAAMRAIDIGARTSSTARACGDP
jgi:hypothetical protein